MQQLMNSDFQWHRDQPDMPSMSASNLKGFLDAPIVILKNKLNEVILELDKDDTQLQQTLTALENNDTTLGAQLEYTNQSLQRLSESHDKLYEMTDGINVLTGSLHQRALQNETDIRQNVQTCQNLSSQIENLSNFTQSLSDNIVELFDGMRDIDVGLQHIIDIQEMLLGGESA